MKSAHSSRWLRRVALTALALAGCREATAPEVVDDGGVPLPLLAHVDPDVVAAVQAARDVVRRDPSSAEAWGKLGDRCFVHDFQAEAARCYARAEELDPTRALYSYRLGWSLINDRPAEAALALERSLRELDDYAPAHETYAAVLLRLGRVEEAAQHYRRASELDPRAAQAETGLGQIALTNGDHEEACTHLEEALRRDPQHVEAHVGLAQAYLALGREEEARHHAEASRALPQESQREDWMAQPNVPPAGARARTKYGRQLVRLGKLDEAEEQYRVALASNPDYYAARLGLAELLVERGRAEDALALLREAERANPDFQQVRVDLVRFQPGQGTRSGR